MKIIIKFLGSLKIITGIENVEFNFNNEISLQEILTKIVQKYPQLKDYFNPFENKFDITILLNNRIVKVSELKNIVINHDCEIILLPSLIGG